MRLAAALALSACALWAQQRTLYVTTPQPIVVSGRSVQLTASVRDAGGNIVPNTTFTWNSGNTAVFTVDANGVATAHRPGVIPINVSGGGANSSIQLQCVPLRIEVTPADAVIKVGDSLQYTARVLDADEKPIDVLNLQWQTAGANGLGINAARMDGSGMLFTNAIGKVSVRAIVNFGGASPQMISQFVGTAKLEIKPADAYRLTRLLASDEAPTSVHLRTAPTQMAVSEGGPLAFIGNLDGYANAVVLADSGRVDVLASTGSPKPLFGGQITDFSGISVNRRGEVLTYTTGPTPAGITNNNALMLYSRQEARPLLLTGTGGLFLGNNVVSRYSLNDNGDAVIFASLGAAQALVRVLGGSLQVIWTNDTPLPGQALPYTFGDWGIDGNGDVSFRVNALGGQAYYRTDGFSTPARLFGTGDSIGGSTVRNVLDFAIAQSGDVAIQADLGSVRSIVRIPKGAPSSQWQVLAVNCCGSVRSIGPAGVLFDGPQGLLKWQSGTAATPVLSLNKLAPNGEPILSVEGAGLTAAGATVAQVSTPSTTIFLRDGAVIADSTTRLDGPGFYTLSGFVTGARAGPAHVSMLRSIFEIDPLGLIPRALFGDRPANTPASATVQSWRKNAAGDLYVSWGNNTGVYRIVDGRPVLQFTNPPCANNVCVGGFNLLGVNSSGAVLWSGGTNGGSQRVYLSQGGSHKLLYEWSANGISAAVDDAGRVMLWHPISGAGLFLIENGQRQLLVPYNGQVLDVPELSNAAPLDATDDGFFFQFGSRYDSTVLARWRQGAWSTLIEKQDLAATGGQINNVQRGRANSRGDLALYLSWNGNSGLLVRMADGSMRSVVTIGDLLPDGSYAAEVTDFDFRDDGRLYLMIRDYDDRIVIYVAEPLS